MTKTLSVSRATPSAPGHGAKASTAPGLSIVIPTYNRPQKVRRVLDRIASLDWSAYKGVQVIVVENGPKLNVYPEGLMPEQVCLLRLHEPVLGKTRAVNLGLEHATGELILVIDDDVLLEEALPRSIVEAAARWPKAAVFGGPLTPLWPDRAPPWYSLELVLVSGQANLGESEREYPDGKNPVGALRVYRHWVFEKYGLFSVQDGLCGSERRGVPGSELLARLAKAEQRVYSPGLAAYHILDPDQTRRRYFLKHAFKWGRGNALGARGFRRNLFGVPLFAIRDLAYSLMRLFLTFLLPQRIAFASLFRSAYCLGYLSLFVSESRYRKRRAAAFAGQCSAGKKEICEFST